MSKPKKTVKSDKAKKINRVKSAKNSKHAKSKHTKSRSNKSHYNTSNELLPDDASDTADNSSNSINSTSFDNFDNFDNSNNVEKLVINSDLLDMMECKADELETTTDLAQKVKLHSELNGLTSDVNQMIEALIVDLDTNQIAIERDEVTMEELSPDEKFDTMKELENVSKEADSLDSIDDLQKQVSIFRGILRKCAILKMASEEDELIIRQIK